MLKVDFELRFTKSIYEKLKKSKNLYIPYIENKFIYKIYRNLTYRRM